MRSSSHHRRALYAPELLEARIAPATFTVINLADAGAGSLRQAVADANDTVLHPGADTIVFKIAAALLLADGTGTIALTTSRIDITEPVTIKGPGIDLITVSGMDARQIFHIEYATASLVPTVISGLSMNDGKSATSGGAIFSNEALTLKGVVVASSYATTGGGGVRVSTAGKILITGSHIVQNEAGTNAGGLYLRGDAGVTVSRSTVSDNTAGNNAGGLYARAVGVKSVILVDRCTIAQNKATKAGGGLLSNSSLTGRIILKNTLISGNTAGTDGGGLLHSGGNLTVDHTTFVANSAKAGGGMAASTTSSLVSTDVIKNSRFLHNTATAIAGTGGGALFIHNVHPMTISGTHFAGNTSAAGGGAIANDLGIDGMMNRALLTITGGSFTGNITAASGGAIAVIDGADFMLKGSTLSGNRAGADGGAIFAGLGAHLTASANKFTENEAAAGGAISTFGSGAAAVPLALTGNLFSANIAGGGGAIFATGDGKVTMKGDKVLGNVSTADDGGGLVLLSTSITLTGLLVQGNHSFDDGGGIKLNGTATLIGCKVLENIADYADGFGGGILIQSGTVTIAKSIVTGNVASRGGGIDSAGATTLDAATRAKVIGNSARTDPNLHGIP